MGKSTIIAWTDHTFNLAWGCFKVSEGCKNCYAESLSKRYGFSVWGPNGMRRTFGARHWSEPIEWNRMAEQSGQVKKVFTSSMCDIFEDHPTINQEREKLWSLIKNTPSLLWQLLTKRPENIFRFLPGDWGSGYKNAWLGTSIESNKYKDRADILRAVPARLRYLSCEPAVGTLDKISLDGIGWVIYGGESGNKYREHDLEWPRQLMRKCQAAGVPFFYKQGAAIRTEMKIELDGKLIREFPEIPKLII